MDNYLILKLIHILSSVILAGTGTGIAFFMYMANRSGDIHAVAVTARHVVMADWIFTTPAVVIQFVTGIWLMNELNYSFTSPWFLAVLGLFFFIGACWIPVIFIQYKLRNIAATQSEMNEVDEQFEQLMSCWKILGILAFSAILIIFWLMVVKPLPVV